ncbi:SRPBCC family protein [Rhizobium sp. SSA_523]|uniref:SRPBCC family protein n=1 Tax=Rhizobium sp. SSA_523 TaxID=2952477 RepID=UPI002090EE7B|nr:SRPBCC family protein [Rhizobium sp. SSA_523]MCO5731858.1 SRPBCC family protein [Rhizobium sp. SSA_523]WKC25716.1 SRPBCC family protein [Rhizobium sp. SSA_523]
MPFTIRLHRVLKAPPERVFRAFTDADAMVKWNPPHGFTAHMHVFEPRVGGAFRMSFTNFTTGESHSFGGRYLEIIENERLRYTDQFDDPNLPGEIETTVEMRSTVVGTELKVTQSGLPDVIPEAACYLGWQESLSLLQMLVEPEIRQP